MNDFCSSKRARVMSIVYVASKIQFFSLSHFIRNLVHGVEVCVCMWQKYFSWHRFKPSVHVSYNISRNVCIYMQGILGEEIFSRHVPSLRVRSPQINICVEQTFSCVTISTFSSLARNFVQFLFYYVLLHSLILAMGSVRKLWRVLERIFMGWLKIEEIDFW